MPASKANSEEPPSAFIDAMDTDFDDTSSTSTPLSTISSTGSYKVPHVLVSLHLEENQTLDARKCARWLDNFPLLAKWAKVEAVFPSYSTLMILSVPIPVWDMLPDHPACSFVGYVTAPKIEAIQGNSAIIGDSKDRQRQASKGWETSVSDKSYANASGNHKIPELPATGAVDDGGESTKNRHTDSENDGGRSPEGKSASPSHPKQEIILGTWTQAVGEAIEGMGAAQRAINNLQGMFTSHMDDLSRVNSTNKRLEQLEEDCREKDKVLQEQETAIGILRTIDAKVIASLEAELSQITREKGELKLERTKLESRVEEERYTMQRKFEESLIRVEKNHETHMKEYKAYFARTSNEINARAIALEAEKRRALATAEQQEKKLKVQADELNQLKQRYDILNKATNSFKSKKEDLEKELEIIKREFTLENKTVAYFEQQFADICGEIEKISLKYFRDIDEEDWEEVHNRLIAEDSCFKSIPVDDSEDSSDLCAAHAQRIISAAIYDDVWKPLRSELTFQIPEFGKLLAKISDALDKTDQHRRSANVWTALTMRALQALDADAEAAISPVSQSEQNIRSPGCNRANSVVSKVIRVLGPLVSAPQFESLRTDLLTVVDSSIDVWNNAQAGGLRLTIDPFLDRAQREEWRSQRFDPVSPLADGLDLDSVSKTRPRVFILFPRIVARTQEKLLLGSCPQVEPIVIHPGKGLPEWSPLVMCGKHDQEEREERLNKAIENVKELRRSSLVSGHGRNESTGSLASGLLNPNPEQAQSLKPGTGIPLPEPMTDEARTAVAGLQKAVVSAKRILPLIEEDIRVKEKVQKPHRESGLAIVDQIEQVRKQWNDDQRAQEPRQQEPEQLSKLFTEAEGFKDTLSQLCSSLRRKF
ncbi:hypothetical protein ACEPPN_000204 [Leptodophora sp. 'Broadleaf-Isolate-01']